MMTYISRRSIIFISCLYVLLPAIQGRLCLAEPVSLDTLQKERPRLILQPDSKAQIQHWIETDRIAQEIYQRLKKEAESLLDEPTVRYEIVGPRLLTQSRRCLDRIYTLGLMFLLDGHESYKNRAVEELRAAASFPDWNPSHFLDTAEMTHAFAIGYDWLNSHLSNDEKQWIKTALIQKGLNAYLSGLEKNSWWNNSQHNWNQVCHGGIGIGALAIADEAPDLAMTILKNAVEKLPLALQHYAPDGGWNEGPGYWHYATRYTVYFLASLRTSLGTDFGLSDHQGLDNAGMFRIHFEGPTGYSFNYADAGARVSGTHEMYWLAKRYNRPVYAWFQRQDTSNPHALDLVWFSDEGKNPEASGAPLDAYYKGVDVVFLRSQWNDRNALFVGFKGGDNKANHSHLDLGSFVLDALGERWAVDLGGDNYNLPGYFGSKRWTYYRLINESHNTLVIDGKNQDPSAAAPIIDFHSSPEWAYAITDLSNAYHLKSVKRGIAMVDRQWVLIQDEIQSDTPVQIEWGMMTPAEIQLDENQARLEYKQKAVVLQIHSPQNARFGIESASPPEPQRRNEGMKKLIVTLPDSLHSVQLAISIQPVKQQESIPSVSVRIPPLDRWSDGIED